MTHRSKPTRVTLGALAIVTIVRSSAAADDACNAPVAEASVAGTAEDVFARGRAAYDAKRFPEAAAILRAVARAHPDDALASKAAMLSLDSLSQIAPGSNLCLPVMAADTDEYSKALCTKAKPGVDRNEDCSMLRSIARSAIRLDGEMALRNAGAEKGEARRKLARKAAGSFMQAFGTQAEACKQHRASECSHAEELVYDASVALHVAGDDGQAFAVRAILFDPAYGLGETPIARRAAFDHAQQLVVLTEFDRAATFFERYATDSPQAEHAADALENALVLRAGLGQYDEALSSLGKLQKLFGKKLGERLEQTTLRLARDLVSHERWTDAEKLLRGLVRDAKPLVRALSRSLLAQTLLARGKTAEAEKLFESLAHASPTDIVQVSTGMPAGDVVAKYDLADLAVAIGGARLHVADEARDVAMKLVVKKGQPDSLKKKLEAIERAESAYRSVAGVEPFPPPAEVIAAARRVARMHAQAWGQTYLALGKDAAESLERRAIGAYSSCAVLAVKYEVATAEAQTCFEWLEHHDRAHHPPLDELFAHARFQEALTSRPVPLRRDGEPVEGDPSTDDTSP